jgi:predicted AAA+ superfamily ATPase
MSFWGKINFNPNLNHNDSLDPEEIEEKVNERNRDTRDMARRAYETGGVPESASRRASDHSSITRQTPEAKKARRDAETWHDAKSRQGDDSDCHPTMHVRRVLPYNWEDDDDE